MATIPSITTWSFEQVLTASALNGNFATIRDALVARGLFTDEPRTMTAALTFSTAPVFPNAQTFAAGVVVTTGGVTVTAGGLTVTAGGLNVTGASVMTGAVTGLTDVTASGVVTGGTFAGSGASLTNLPAANITGILPAISGANLTSLNATNIASGTLNAARLPAIPLATTSQRVAVLANVFAVDSAEPALLVAEGLAAWQGTVAPLGNGTSRWINVTIGGTAYRIECWTVA